MSLPISAALIMFVITIATSLIGLFGAPKLIDRSLFRPDWFLRRRQYDTVVLSGLVHADLMHLIFNMMTFYFFGFLLEREIGSTHFLLLKRLRTPSPSPPLSRRAPTSAASRATSPSPSTPSAMSPCCAARAPARSGWNRRFRWAS